MSDANSELQQRIRAASEQATPLCIVGTGSKDFYGGPLLGEPLLTTALHGIVDYDPAELVVTARAGTTLADLETTLAASGQMLAFEPPRFAGRGTLGGAVAAGLSGPRRPYAGAVRDFVLGVRMLDGQGRALRFGGRVIKNVAGFDVSRLLAGSLGTLGVITEISLRTLPRPAKEITLVREADEEVAIRLCNVWAGQPEPLSATAHFDGHLYVRLSGAITGVQAARARIGGELLDDGAAFWLSLRDHTHEFFANAASLYRVSVPATTAPLQIGAPQLIEWGGALRWLADELPPEMREHIVSIGGHVARFRSALRDIAGIQELSPALFALHRRLKQVFDPHGIFNRSRLYDY